MLTYSDLVSFDTFDERLEYLRTNLPPSEFTFGGARPLNQAFYASRAWKNVRDFVIARDMGFDLGIPGMDIFGRVLVHHMNPLKPKDIFKSRSLDPEFLITVSHPTHLSIHFGHTQPEPIFVERRPGDTKLW